MPRNNQPSIINHHFADLARLVKGEVFTDVIHRAAYSSDASIYQILPSCVVYPRDAEDISAVVQFAKTGHIPVAARGAGSGVAGESLCSGILLDVTRYMTRIRESGNERTRITGSRYEIVMCEPGVVLDDLNNLLARYDRKFGPDPSTANRAAIGGCVANNATGAHSLQFGYTGDYVERIEAVLADGSIVELTNNADPQDLNKNLSRLAKDCVELLSGKRQVIENALPATKRNRSGYNIAGVVHDGKIDLARLMAGSEGTLALFTKIWLRTVPLPKDRGLLQLEFDSLEKMAKAVPIIVDCGASACELMDRTLIAMAIEHLPEYRDVLPANAMAALLVEHVGESLEEVKEKIKKTESTTGNLAVNRTIILDEQIQKRVWKARKDAVPLLERGKGRKRPVPFIEDVSVEHKNLGAYITGLQTICKKYDIETSYYGHAGDGELHIRPYLDLGEQGDLEKMVKVANDVFALAWSLGGTVSGEHAVGLVRAAFLRRQYGDEFYNLLCGIKKIFDPDGLLNPGKIISEDADVMVKNLKAGHRVKPERTFAQTGVIFENDEIALELEQCSGCGVCRGKENQLRMCPIFRATGDELAGSRAKMNVLRFWSSGQMKEEYFESPEFRMFLDLCVNCKACQTECPAGVDVSKIMAAARAEYVRRKGLRLTERILGKNRYLSVLGSAFAPISNFVMRRAVTKWFLEKTLGLDRRRQMPKFSFGTFLKAGRDYLDSCKPHEMPIDKVAYFVDTYVNYNDHELGFAVINILRHNDIEVILPKQRPAPLPAIVYGDVNTAEKDLSWSVKHLAAVVREGYKIICSEPSAALCLKQELRHYVEGEDASIVSASTYELMEYLLGLLKQKQLKPAKMSRKSKDEYVYHTPCHLFATGTYEASIEILKNLCGLNVADLKAGCCGLAGTFGMQKKNYELSKAIAKTLKKALDETPAKYVLTECAACAMQIEHISDKLAIHPIKVLAECYKG
ncbi:MAG: anaerobic glycerol-3-phosphate dehydrogenase subunit C [Sedimentisphaerales bacterium]|nr:anaerobic glycerol-3-phosphate dehydrogenase subunit C [Sedimentisphaerales bacterium]